MQAASAVDERINSNSRNLLLEARDISKSYGGVRALIDADFFCGVGEVHALLGENGAGKSTLVKVLCGVVKQDTGTIKIRGKEIAVNSPAEANHQGIAAVFQELSVIPDLTVAENIFLGHEPKGKFGFIDFKKMRDLTIELFQRLELNIDPEAMVKDLPLAQQQLVEIAKALAKDPDILILDEATSALGKQEVEHLFKLVRDFKKQGKSAIFISHRMDEIEAIADRATVFRDAHRIEEFEVGKVSNQQIITWIAGRDLQKTFPEKQPPLSKEIALNIQDLGAGNVLNGIDLAVAKGEILGIAGLQGQGQSEFLLSLFGAFRTNRGKVEVLGKSVRLNSPTDAIRAGISLVPEDRKNGGLLLPRSVRENLALMTLNRRQVMGLISNAAENTAIQHMSELLKIKSANFENAVGNLSGGNQQKVVIGKTLLTKSQVLLLADPTRGIDIGTKSEIYQLIRNLANEGITILLYSTELPELIGLCNRVAVFFEGRINRLLTGEQIEESTIIHAALGLE